MLDMLDICRYIYLQTSEAKKGSELNLYTRCKCQKVSAEDHGGSAQLKAKLVVENLWLVRKVVCEIR